MENNTDGGQTNRYGDVYRVAMVLQDYVFKPKTL